MRLLALRGGGGRLARPGNSIELLIPADGIGWFFLLNVFAYIVYLGWVSMSKDVPYTSMVAGY